MKLCDLNPYVRFSDRRVCSASYREPICAYDYRLFQLISGECALNLPGGSMPLRTGHCVLIAPGTPYGFVFQEKLPATMYNLNFSMGWFPGDGLPFHPDTPERFRPEQMPEYPDRKLLPEGFLRFDMPEISDTVGRIVLERERNDPLCDELCSALLKQALVQLFRSNGGEADPTAAPVRKIQRYLEEHCRESLTGEILGKELGYHPVYLNRIFRRETGTSLHQYQMRYRVRMACTMLSSTDLSIREIADSLGFAGASYFSEVFRRVSGCTPLEYRAQTAARKR